MATRYYLTLLLAFIACSSVEDQIEQVTKGGEQGKAATMRLLLAPDDVTPQIIAASEDTTLSFEERITLLNLLRRFHVREADERIAALLTDMTTDPDPQIRRAVVRIIGDVGQKDQLTELSSLLQTELDEKVLQQTVSAISRLGKWRHFSSTRAAGRSRAADRADLPLGKDRFTAPRSERVLAETGLPDRPGSGGPGPERRDRPCRERASSSPSSPLKNGLS